LNKTVYLTLICVLEGPKHNIVNFREHCRCQEEAASYVSGLDGRWQGRQTAKKIRAISLQQKDTREGLLEAVHGNLNRAGCSENLQDVAEGR